MTFSDYLQIASILTSLTLVYILLSHGGPDAAA